MDRNGRYRIERETMSKDPAKACYTLPIMFPTLHADKAQSAVDTARQWVREYAGADIPRAFVVDTGKRQGKRIFSVWKDMDENVREDKPETSA